MPPTSKALHEPCDSIDALRLERKAATDKRTSQDWPKKSKFNSLARITSALAPTLFSHPSSRYIASACSSMFVAIPQSSAYEGTIKPADVNLLRIEWVKCHSDFFLINFNQFFSEIIIRAQFDPSTRRCTYLFWQEHIVQLAGRHIFDIIPLGAEYVFTISNRRHMLTVHLW